jgi:RNA polymerase sigma factor (sigma-70 family)
MTDQEIIALIRAGKNEKPIKLLYKEYPKIEKLILSSGGNKPLAEEIFNDSLLLLIEKIRDEKFELTAKLSTYFYGINRFLMLNELRKQKRSNIALEWSDTLIISSEDLSYDHEKEQKLNLMERVLHHISEKCKSILELFYFQKWSMEQIAQKMNYSSVNSAKTQKFKCIEQASKLALEMQNMNTKNA